MIPIHYAVTEEGQNEPSRCTIIQTYLQSIYYIETARASCCQATGGVPDVMWATSCSPVGVSCKPLNGECGVKGKFGYLKILKAIDVGNMAAGVLALIDLSAASATLDHATIIIIILIIIMPNKRPSELLNSLASQTLCHVKQIVLINILFHTQFAYCPTILRAVIFQ